MNRERLVPALIVAGALGIGLLVLQRWVAETKTAALVLVGVWIALVGIAAFAYARRRPDLKLPVLGTFAVVAAATVAIGIWTSRDIEVDEDVVVATSEASETQRAVGLASGGGAEASASSAGNDEDEKPKKEQKPDKPVALASGEFVGVDGHAGTGIGTYVKEPDGDRVLTFTEFDIDSGAKIVVWLTQDENNLDDRVDLGSLKGNVGDQQYEIPDDVDLSKYDTVVIYCTPFTVRMAVASLS